MVQLFQHPLYQPLLEVLLAVFTLDFNDSESDKVVFVFSL